MSIRRVKQLFTMILCVSLLGCAPNFEHEPKPLTPEQFKQLLYAPVPEAFQQEPYAPKFELKLMPQVFIEGQSAKVTCIVPDNLQADQIAFGVTDLQVTGPKVVDLVQNEMFVNRIPCGTWTAFCVIRTPEGKKALQQTIEVAGCDGK